MKHAVKLLKRYRDEFGYLCFNDDIQGTAATALAGLYGALRCLGKRPQDICKQRYVVCGAGNNITMLNNYFQISQLSNK